jgi:hypothetical protein
LALAQEQPADLPTFSVIQVIQENPAHVYVTGGYELASTGVTPNVGQLIGIIGGAAPVRIGKTTAVRPNFRIAFQQLPGATVIDPANFGSLEGMVGLSKNLTKTGGFRLAATSRVWVNQRLAHGDALQPTVPATYGWGFGFEGHGDDGTHITILGGRDTYGVEGAPLSTAPSGLQARALGRIAIPGTDVTTAPGVKQKYGSVLFDARLSFVRPDADPLAPSQLTTVVLYGVAIEIQPLWGRLFNRPQASAPAPAPEAAPPVSKKLDQNPGPTDPAALTISDSRLLAPVYLTPYAHAVHQDNASRWLSTMQEAH